MDSNAHIERGISIKFLKNEQLYSVLNLGVQIEVYKILGLKKNNYK